MKKTLLLIASCCLFTAVKAQLQLLSTEMLPFGAVVTDKEVQNLAVIDTNIQGQGATWNFSAIVNNASVPDLVVTMVDPATTPYGSNFPNSNYGYHEIQGTYNAYRYFSLTSSKMERVGSYVSNVNTYNDPQIEYVFPLQFGSVSNDTWDNTNSSFGGTYDLECIGTGTLTIPGGTYNALMVRVHIVEGFLDYYAYFWYSADNGAVLLEYIIGDGTFVPIFAIYMSSLSAGVMENDWISGTRYNNPVINNFELNFQPSASGNYTYNLANTIGQSIMKRTGEMIAGNTETINVDFSNLSPGIYFFVLQPEKTGERSKTIKIVKQ